MSNTSPLYNLLVLSAALLAFGLACYAAGRSSQPSRRVFMLLMLAVAGWSFCSVFANLAPDPLTRRFWVGIAYIGIAFTGPLWLLFALLNTGDRQRLPRWVPLAIGMLGTASVLLVLGNGALTLWRVGGIAAAQTVRVVHGPLFWAHTTIAYSTVLGGMALYARAFKRSRRPYRDQARLIFLAALLPLVVNAAYLAGPQSWRMVDLTPVALALSGLVFGYTIGRHRLLTLSPIARQVVIDSMGDGLIVVDMNRTVVEHNPAAVALAALTCSAIGSHLAHATTDRALGQVLLDMLAGDSLEPHEREIAVESAQPRRLHISQTPLLDRRQPIGTLIVLRDITRRVQIEETLTRRVSDLTLLHTVASAVGSTLETHDLLRAIVTTTRDALGVTSATVALLDDPPSSMTIVAESTAYDRPSVIGHQLRLTGGRGAAVLQADTPLMSNDAQHDERLAFFHDLLARRDTRSLLVAPLRAKETLIGILNLESTAPHAFRPEDVALVRMIAGYVAAALANARLFDASQEASRLKSSILDTVSHEFRTPITAIIGFTELFQEHMLGSVTSEQHEALDAIQRGAHRLLRLVDDLLDLARIESGKLDLEIHPVEVQLCVQEVAHLMAPQFRQKRLDLRVEIADNLPPAYADSTWLRRILINLLTNAIRFTDQGQVTVRAYELDGAAHALDGEPEPESASRRLALEVQDTGAGIAAADQQLIFEAFRRASNAPASIAGGSGLGLAISRRVIEQMHGQLTLHSQPSRGSTFMIVLPIAELAREHP